MVSQVERGDTSPLLRIEAVTRRYDRVVAVDRISLDIGRGEFFSLLGPSGCGKTTLLRMIAGFEPLDGGRILLSGQDIGPLPPHRRPVNTVFQHYALFPHLSVFENVAFGLRRQKVDEAEVKRRVIESLALVRLDGFGERKPNQLSGGQRQRVALARALVLRPQVLLLDEPLGALDHQLRVQMQGELKQLQRACGITFIFVTHDQREALAMSDRIAVLSRGHIEQVGTGMEIYERPVTEFVARFMGASNLLAGRVLRLEGERARVALRSGPECEVDTFGRGGLAPETAVQVMLRPEWLELSRGPAPAPAFTSWPVTVKDRVYLGDTIRWVVEGLGSEIIEMSTEADEPYHESHQGPDIQPGEGAHIVWRTGAGVILPAGAEA